MNNIELLKNLCLANGVSGNEKEIREIILSEITPFCDDIKIDNIGNIIAFKKGEFRAESKLMISAHMDEVGFVVTNITSEGYIKFSCVGGIDRRVVIGSAVNIGNNNVFGTIGIKPVHLTNSDDKNKISSYENMYIDIGSNSKEQTEELINLGDSICFNSPFEYNSSVIKAKALDDRIGCYILIELIKRKLKYDTYFTFVVQEEVGLRGAKVAAYSVEPDFALVIEATTAADLPNVSTEKQVCKVLQGTVVSFMDRSTIYDKELYKLAFDCAKELKCNIQTKKAVAGGNDSGVIHSTKSGVRTLALSLPCRYLHSPISLIAEKDVDDTIAITAELAQRICGNTL